MVMGWKNCWLVKETDSLLVKILKKILLERNSTNFPPLLFLVENYTKGNQSTDLKSSDTDVQDLK